MMVQSTEGLPYGVSPSKIPESRSEEFSSGVTGGGSTHSVQQLPPMQYTPRSVIDPVVPPPNGESATTYDASRVLSYYR